MMRDYALVVTLALLLALCVGAQAQQTEDNLVDVTVSGMAAAPADWLEIRLTLESSAPSAETAMTMNRDDAQRATGKLVAAGIPAEKITSSPPSFADNPYVSMSEDGPERQWTATSRLIVRVDEIQPDSVYEDAGRIIDVVAGAAKTSPRDYSAMRTGMGSDGVLTFGVKDDEALSTAAYEDAMRRARKAAEKSAAAAGMKLGPLLRIRANEYFGSNAMLRGLDARSVANQAIVVVSITATYRME